jgi:hypothetical protein
LKLGSTLRITGDADNDLIEIVDSGGGALNVNGTDYCGIRRLTIATKGGDDEVYYEAARELSLANIQINLGLGDDIAELNLGTVGGTLRSEIKGGLGADEISTAFDVVLAGGDARSFVDGGLDDDILRCAQNNVAGNVSCMSRGGIGDDQIFCEKTNVMAGGRAECNSNGGIGDDTIKCTELNVAGHTSCIGSGGVGRDVVSCTLTNLTETGSALCLQTGGAGNDTITCDKGTIHGKHVCFTDGGSGNDTMNWVVRGAENSGAFQCTMYAGTGDDQINIVQGTASEEVGLTGTVEYFADTGTGDDIWSATVNYTPDSDGVFLSFTVLLGTGNDTAILSFLGLGNTQVLDGFFTGGSGEDNYVGPPLVLLSFPVEGFEIGV